MKNQFARFLAVIIVLFTLPTSVALPQHLQTQFFSNPLLLNGHAVSYQQLSSLSRGIITLVNGNPGSKTAKKVPFLIYLMRAGKIVDAGSHTHAVSEFELSKILGYARVDDQIVIDPTDKNDRIGKRTITVGRMQLIPQFNWLIGFVKNQPGC
ncbi:hypothetical protein [Dyadobacter arcticus]|uniref:Uncharacterized protein n=1 Tax=Dyadobacter arcticus TaxID=1078754 RepID=A0ABX0UFV5_9BACT|nr:hypothetical protein [Dyadobacter arcticus]NIJ51866.1 hypothetical protein [Dyadobacter arcticus]